MSRPSFTIKYVRMNGRSILNELTLPCTAGCSNNKGCVNHRFPAKLEIDVCFMFFNVYGTTVLNIGRQFDSRPSVPTLHYYWYLRCNIQISTWLQKSVSQKTRISQISIGYYDAVSTFYQYTCTYSIPWS